MTDPAHIRNFAIIAHIDHGKSTLADRMIQHCGGLADREMREQVLDSMDIERERGITVKAQTVRLAYAARDGRRYQLNLMDTPGHVDFTYEVSRSLAACEGSVLLVDSSQGVEAQTLANVYQALEADHEIVLALNKTDLPAAEPARVARQIEEVIGLESSAALLVSGKTGDGVVELLDAVVEKLPPPGGDRDAPLKALLVDSWYDPYLGVVILVRVNDGSLVKGQRVRMMAARTEHTVEQVGVFTPKRRNALAGAIVLRTADPEYRTGFLGRVRLGNAAARQVSGVANVPLVEGRAALRVAFDRREGDGFVLAPTRGEDDYDRRTSETLRAKLRFDPTPRLRGLLTVSRTDSRGGDSRILASRFPGERVNLSDHPADDGSRHRFGVLELGYRWTDTLSLESVSTLYAHDYRREEDLDGTPASAGVLDYTTDDRWTTQQVLLRYEGSGRRRGVLGFHYADLEDRLRADAAGPGELAGLPPGFVLTSFFSTDERTRNAALFGEADFELSDAWTVTLGARYDDERRETENIRAVVSDPPLPAFPPAPSSGEVVASSYRAFLPKAALTRALTPTFSASASWQRGYRAGGRSVAVLSQQVNDFDPEFTDNFELALRAGAPGRRWFFHANFFLSDWSAQQVRVLTDLGLPVDTLTVNAGESTLSGAEAQAGYWISPAVRAYASVGLLRTRFDDFRDADRDFTGNEFPHAPPWSLLAGLSVRFGEEWSGRAEVGAEGESFSAADNDPRFRVPGRALVNGRFGYRRGSWGVFAYGRNLLDEDYLLEAWQPSTPLLGAFGRAGAPREFGIELDFRY